MAPTILILGACGPSREAIILAIEGGLGAPLAQIRAGSYPGRPEGDGPFLDIDRDVLVGDELNSALGDFLSALASETPALVIDHLDALLARLEIASDGPLILQVRAIATLLGEQDIPLIVLSGAPSAGPTLAGLFSTVCEILSPNEATPTLSFYGRGLGDVAGIAPALMSSSPESLGAALAKRRVSPPASPPPRPTEAPKEGAAPGKEAIPEVPADYRLRYEDIAVREGEAGKDPRAPSVWQNRAIARARRLEKKGQPVTDPFQRALLAIAWKGAKGRKIKRIQEAVEGDPELLNAALAAVKHSGSPLIRLNPWDLSHLERAVKRILRERRDKAAGGKAKSDRAPRPPSGGTKRPSEPVPPPEHPKAGEPRPDLADLFAVEVESPHAPMRLRIIAVLAGEDADDIDELARIPAPVLGEARAKRLIEAIGKAQKDREMIDGEEGRAVRSIYDLLADLPPNRRFNALASFFADAKLSFASAKSIPEALSRLNPDGVIRLARLMAERLAAA